MEVFYCCWDVKMRIFYTLLYIHIHKTKNYIHIKKYLLNAVKAKRSNKKPTHLITQINKNQQQNCISYYNCDLCGKPCILIYLPFITILYNGKWKWMSDNREKERAQRTTVGNNKPRAGWTLESIASWHPSQISFWKHGTKVVTKKSIHINCVVSKLLLNLKTN